MSTAIRVVPPAQPEVIALSTTCEEIAKQSSLDRCELAVKSRLETGINNDNDLRQADEMLHAVVVAADALDHARKECDPRIAAPITAAYALHKSLIATVAPWKKRWSDLKDSLSGAIIRYKREQEDLARRQQAQIDQAAADQRRRLEIDARVALRNGDVATAQAAMQEADHVVAPIIMTGTPVLDHGKDLRPWEVEVTDGMALVQAIAAGIVPLSAIKEWDVAFLKKEATKRNGLPADWAGLYAQRGRKLSVRR